MKKRYKILIALVVLLVAAYFWFTRDTREINVLVFSKTASFRHESIGAGKAAIIAMGKEHNFSVDTTENSEVFTEKTLRNYNVIVFLNTTGEVLNDMQQLEMNRWIQAGGGFVGIHAAADTEYEWPWYGELVGAYFNGHPNNPNVRDAVINVVDKNHNSTKHLPAEWKRTDEWYNYKDIRPEINVLLNLDEKSYEGGTNGDNHPIAWYRDFDGGRTWYTGLGHTNEAYTDPEFIQMLWGGIEYAAGPGVPVNYNNSRVAPEENRFQKVVLEFNLNEPMELDMLPGEDVLFIERRGDIKLYKKTENKVKLVTKFPVFSDLEDGLLGLAVDPDYEKNHWIYLYYSPVGKEAVQRLSRFTFIGDSLERASEKIILTVNTQREQCCHSGGSVEFGPDRLLYLSVGDNTSPRETGYGPIDERPGKSPWDAQKSSANTNDLRGKILRIKPEDNGTYSIPDGNLFTDAKQGRPEIYVMGVRNPFRISIDQKTGFLYWGDVGPDAGKDSVGFGSKGYDELNQAKKAGNFGWPYFIGNNYAYNEYDYGANKSGPLYDPKKPVNNSPNNTGAKELPAATPPMYYYPYTPSNEFPLVGEGGRNAMAGPVFYKDRFPESTSRFPDYYDKKLFTYDWMRGWIMAVTLDEKGDYVRMERFLPGMMFNNMVDVVFSPAGDMYALEYGTNWFSQNMDARLIHLTYSSANRVPVAAVSADKTVGKTPLTVTFNSDATTDPDGDEITYEWNFGDGETSTEKSPAHEFKKAGEYKVSFSVTDPSGEKASQELLIIAGNDLPELKINFSGNSRFYWNNSTFDYSIEVTDSEDGSVGNGIDAKAITFTADYLAHGKDVTEIIQGHQANMEASANLVGKTLYENSDCRSCHHATEKSVGPAMKQISDKYADNEGAVKMLVDKVIKGGSGVWGDLMMAPHPQLSVDDTEKMIRYMLSIGNKTPQSGLPNKGVYALNKHKPTEKEGTYIFTASYTDRGGNGIKPLTATKVIVLSYPFLGADQYSEKKKAQTFKITKDIYPAIEEETTIVLPNHEGSLRYKGIDFTGVGVIKIGAAVAPNYFSGGTLDIFIDGETGQKIGSAKLEIGLTDLGFKELLVPISEVKGLHDLIIKVNCTDPSKVFGGIATLEFVKK
ncbi:MAG TPA: ThuA domain-containing protein [Cyclobacteriaceae bacterium]|nr:ThuA domain-containing protein [Cytophagales bacterium]HRE67488.1 ThuA domain-containing protein [Cyclobacteriaceae bacterium]HRF33404.1 ThuA domain-containing protein [Cyclobacteriaceae bacterium]